MFRKNFFLIACLVIYNFAFAQLIFKTNYPSDNRADVYAFTNANVFVDYQTFIPNATLIVANGVVKEVGKNISIPKNAIVANLEGSYIYPGFIELNSSFGLPTPENENFAESPIYEPQKQGAFYVNDAINAEYEAHKNYIFDAEKAKSLKEFGFTSLLSHYKDGIARGSGVLVNLCSKKENETIVLDKASQHFSFSKGSSQQSYPSSLMGSIALLRQTFYDLKWYEKNKNAAHTNIALQSMLDNKSLPSVIEANDPFNIMRANKIAQEFGFNFIYIGNGEEYQNLDEISKVKTGIVVPVKFPKAFKINNIFDEELISYHQLKSWELAPFNLKMLYDKNVPFVISSNGVDNISEFNTNIALSIKAGLPYKEALKALTFTPAQLLKADKKIGSLQKGFFANFIISSDSLFKEKSEIYEVWVQGEKSVLKEIPNAKNDFRGVYALELYSKNVFVDSFTLSITGKIGAFEAKINKDSLDESVSYSQNATNMSFTFNIKNVKYDFVAWQVKKDLFEGKGKSSNNQTFTISLRKELSYTEPLISDSLKKAEQKANFKNDSIFKAIGRNIYPSKPFGFENKPKAKSILIKNATIWTSEQEGKLENQDIFIQNGKIAQIGKLSLKADTTIDATGKHITAGIIDEHSHIAISGGVNECSNSITAEVRIGDIIDPTDINIYRNLAGGVTAAQLLHGSCNCIGGQSGIIKLKWGSVADEFLIKNTDGFIKFALGENVKQSNFGDIFTLRYPQTRMGVEQVYLDVFTLAREYESSLKSNPNTRRDLQLDAIVEILNKKRFISCHSYVQSEIIMLMRVAEKFGFKVNTFTHILEGYKVADLMAKHGAGASTFSDWWSYKFEVKDAIPYNAGIMHKIGVNVAINSDNAEMARRLNHEAAKVVKYSGVSEEEALKMITINPAKLLHIDSRTGSVKVGKDADLVIWSANPLSIYAKVENTFIEGVCLFDINQDLKIRKLIIEEKSRILSKMYNYINTSPTISTQEIFYTPERFWHCGTGGEEN